MWIHGDVFKVKHATVWTNTCFEQVCVDAHAISSAQVPSNFKEEMLMDNIKDTT